MRRSKGDASGRSGALRHPRGIWFLTKINGAGPRFCRCSAYNLIVDEHAVKGRLVESGRERRDRLRAGGHSARDFFSATNSRLVSAAAKTSIVTGSFDDFGELATNSFAARVNDNNNNDNENDDGDAGCTLNNPRAPRSFPGFYL